MSDKIIVGLFKGRVKLTSWLYDSLFPLNTICSQYFWSWRGDEMSLFCPLCANMFVAKSGWLPGAQAAGAWFFPAWLLLISFIPCCVCVCVRASGCVYVCVSRLDGDYSLTLMIFGQAVQHQFKRWIKVSEIEKWRYSSWTDEHWKEMLLEFFK